MTDSKTNTNYAQLFGTPERAAKTLDYNCSIQATCTYCIMANRPCLPCSGGNYEVLLDWLNEKAVG